MWKKLHKCKKANHLSLPSLYSSTWHTVILTEGPWRKIHLRLSKSGADPENCFGRGTLDESSKTMKRVYPSVVWLGLCGSAVSSSSGVWGEAPAANDFGHYSHNFVRFHACFSAFWNLTSKADKNRLDPTTSVGHWFGGATCPLCSPSGSTHDLNGWPKNKTFGLMAILW